MTDRDSFLAAIRAQPADDTARLVYADWLDECGDRGGLDRATAEFIRLSCVRPGAKVMPRKAYPWLLSRGEDGVTVENWKRLLPSVLAVDARHCAPGVEVIGKRAGRMVTCSITAPVGEAFVQTRNYAVGFEFSRGFMLTAFMHSPALARAIFPALLADQPLVELYVTNLVRSAAGPLVELVEAAQGGAAAKRFFERLIPM